jgi:DNA-binding NarL/FixJ family response regulator
VIVRSPHPDRPAGLWLVEDEPAYRDALLFLIGHVSGLRLDRAFDNAESVIDAAETAKGGQAVVPDVVLMDVNLPGVDGIEATARLRAALPDSRVIVLTVRDDADTVFAALRAGACGYISKGAPVDVLVQAIQQALDGGMLVPPAVARRVLAFFADGDADRAGPPAEQYGISGRERDVLRGMVDGLTQKEIADALFISPSTVSGHVQRIYEKLRVHTINAAVAKALRERLV